MEPNAYYDQLIEELLASQPEGKMLCATAREYEAVMQPEFQRLEYATAIQVNVLKIWATDLFFAYLVQLDAEHKRQLKKRRHCCVPHIFYLHYKKLLERARRLTPPPLSVPPPPPPPPKQHVIQLPGMTFGEYVEQEE